MLTFQVADPLLDHAAAHFPPSAVLLQQRQQQLGIDCVVASVTAGHLKSSGSCPSMMRKLHNVMSAEFGEDELETLDTWLSSLEQQRIAVCKLMGCNDVDDDNINQSKSPHSSDDEAVTKGDDDGESSADSPRRVMAGHRFNNVELPSCVGVYVLAVLNANKNNNNEDKVVDADEEEKETAAVVVGAIVAEVYLTCNTAMVSYVVTAPSYRGNGLAKKMSAYIAHHMDALCRAYTGSPLAALLVDVEEVAPLKHEEKSAADERIAAKIANSIRIATERQHIWSRIGFSPVEKYALRYPSYLGRHTYCVGVYRDVAAAAAASHPDQQQQLSLDSQRLYKFVEVMGVSVFYDEVNEMKRMIKESTENRMNETHTLDFFGVFNKELLDPTLFDSLVRQFVRNLKVQFAALPPRLRISDEFWT